ncbi:WxcM-like domain-containing protein [Pseudopedobacter saltans DSM 12145]|uniref:WxcM-like domain-containing protein n=1 Tax=Pseudopedobacter saltans (strain ATCC 51119 / DSM 12145 / JCM 21818 / CCUG 39354 / LMG 10337 / NBRC 100064 / NCIMB 13643) TaxID=762903 RepID=F0SBE0_PSESL|nr:FdtA/QdtA family cupin domain-containing protein [Pseudopedobacter saltans]ADY53767.1 WxcM-like domain-containing protein [Pseudopedobacter saltans DSM 12145]
MVASIYNCNVIELTKIHNRAGNITPVHGEFDIPFSIRRVYYLYDVPGGETRGGHAHKELHQLIIAASGSFDVILDDGKNKRTFTLNRPNYGLYVCPKIWRDLSNFSSGAVLLVLASERYSEADYIREYSEFLEFSNG